MKKIYSGSVFRNLFQVTEESEAMFERNRRVRMNESLVAEILMEKLRKKE